MNRMRSDGLVGVERNVGRPRLQEREQREIGLDAVIEQDPRRGRPASRRAP
jgi:hypothetical protein